MTPISCTRIRLLSNLGTRKIHNFKYWVPGPLSNLIRYYETLKKSKNKTGSEFTSWYVVTVINSWKYRERSLPRSHALHQSSRAQQWAVLSMATVSNSFHDRFVFDCKRDEVHTPRSPDFGVKAGERPRHAVLSVYIWKSARF